MTAPAEWILQDHRTQEYAGLTVGIEVYRDRRGSDSMHSIILPDERIVEVRPGSVSSGAVRSRVINQALSEVFTGDPDPVTYLVGALALAGALDVSIIHPPPDREE